MASKQVGSVKVEWNGALVRRWTKGGADRLYLDRNRGFVDLMSEEALKDYEESDAYHWSCSRKVETINGKPEIVGREFSYRGSEVSISWKE